MSKIVRKFLIDGTPYTVISQKTIDKGWEHQFVLNPPVTMKRVIVHLVYGRMSATALQRIAEAYQAGWSDGYFEAKGEINDEAQRIYVDGEDFTTRHQQGTN